MEPYGNNAAFVANSAQGRGIIVLAIVGVSVTAIYLIGKILDARMRHHREMCDQYNKGYEAGYDRGFSEGVDAAAKLNTCGSIEFNIAKLERLANNEPL